MPKTGHASLKKSLSVFDGVTILVGITIGAGIFSTPQRIAGYFDSFGPIIALWVLAGFFIFAGGLIYAELGTRLPDTGGEYLYITRCFGPFAGFMFGWSQLFIIRTSPVAGLAIITVDYFGHFTQLVGWQHTAACLLVIAVIGTLNYMGVHRAGFYQKLSTILKSGGLLLLVFIGLFLSDGGNDLLWVASPATATLGPAGNAIAAMMLIVFSYMGFERVGYSAGEMAKPRRTIPISMLAGISAIVIIYALANTLFHGVYGMDEIRLHTRLASDVATELVGPFGAGFIAVIVMISATGSINGTMMTAPRVYYAMARDGLFFKWLDHVHPEYRTPSRAVLVHCLWGAVILMARGSFETIIAGMVFAVLIFFALNTLALFKLRRQETGGTETYRVPFYPWLPGVYLAGILALLGLRLVHEPENSIIDLAFVATGLPFYLVWRNSAPPKATNIEGD